MKPSEFFPALKQLIATIVNLGGRLDRQDARLEELRARQGERLDEIKINQGLILSAMNEQRQSKCLRDFEFEVFSQWGEDGIIQHLTRVVDIRNRTFIEFGIGDFSESNCRFLLMKDNWKGFVVDSSRADIQRLKSSYYYWKYHIDAVEAFITRDNIDELLSKSGFEEDLGILSIDIDGNDYFILEAIRSFRPRILICEFNAVFGPDRAISVPYEPGFNRTDKHHSNLYFGASLAAMTALAARKGYALVGTNSIGSNAFYVRNDLLNERLDVLTAAQAYTPSNVRESRDERGELTCLTGDARLTLIRGMPVLNVETNVVERL